MKVALTFVGGAPTVQTNQPEASLDLDGNLTGTLASVATTNKCVGELTYLNVNSNLAVSTPWDVAIAVGNPLVPGLSTTSGQLINVDITGGLPTSRISSRPARAGA
jgi:hypothetical protein